MSGMCYINGVSFPVSSSKECFKLAETMPAPKKEVGLFDNVQASGNLGNPAGLAACTGRIEPDEAIAEAKEEQVTSNNSIMLEEQDLHAIYDELGHKNICTTKLEQISFSDENVQLAVAKRVIEKYMKEDESFPKLNASAKERAIAALAKEIAAKHGADTLYDLIVVGQGSYDLFCNKYPSGQPPTITALKGITPAKVKKIAQNSLAIITSVSPAKMAEGSIGKEVTIVGNNLPTKKESLDILFSCNEVAPDINTPADVQSANNQQTIKKTVDVAEVEGENPVPCDVTVKQCQSVFTLAHPANPNATLNDVLCEDVTLKGAITIEPAKVEAPTVKFLSIAPASGKQRTNVSFTIAAETAIPADVQIMTVVVGGMTAQEIKVNGAAITGKLSIPKNEAVGAKPILVTWKSGEKVETTTLPVTFEVTEWVARKGGGKKQGKPAPKTAQAPKKPQLPACSKFPAIQQKLMKAQGKCQ
ncbi:MAG: hypothetical protein KKA31_00875 [Candidatus Margulisbacteria bacterium]|nr:hypothetical protein [Candidatus Margulisiibacteriota bacterium]